MQTLGLNIHFAQKHRGQEGSGNGIVECSGSGTNGDLPTAAARQWDARTDGLSAADEGSRTNYPRNSLYLSLFLSVLVVPPAFVIVAY